MTENETEKAGVQVNVNQDPDATAPADPATPDDAPEPDQNRVTGEDESDESTAKDDAADE